MSITDLTDASYDEFLRDLKTCIRTAQVKAALAVNREMVLLYWQIGRDILTRQKEQGWGSKIVDRLSHDLRVAFPEMKGFSRTNLLYMRAFAEAYTEEAIVQQAAGQIPWFHNCTLLDKVKAQEERLWYIRQTVEHGWSRTILIHQIESNLYSRQGQAQTSFKTLFPINHPPLRKNSASDDFFTSHFGFTSHFSLVSAGPLTGSPDSGSIGGAWGRPRRD